MIVCAIAILFSSIINNNFFSRIRNIAGIILVPIESGVNRMGARITTNLQRQKDLDAANERIKTLEEQIDTLLSENNRLKADTYELERTRDLLKLTSDYADYETVAARVIAKDSENWFQVFRIDKGILDGISVDMNVLSGSGLCGIVTSVGLNYATVTSIIDDNSRVAAMVQHSGAQCIVEGDIDLYDNGVAKISGLDKGTVVVDEDKIVTSNISTKYLPNILIGYASGVSIDENDLTSSGYVIPVANFLNLFEVVVIKTKKEDSFKDRTVYEGVN